MTSQQNEGSRLSLSPLKYQDTNLVSYNFDVEPISDIYYPSSGIEDYIVLRAYGLEKGIEKRFSLEKLISYAKVESIQANAASGDEDGLTFRVLAGNVELNELRLKKQDIPFNFPSAILTPQLTLSIKANSNILFCWIYLKPVHLLQNIDLNDNIV